MNSEIKKKWVEALRSGLYKQGTGRLRCNDNYCCLGVLCDITDKSKWRMTEYNFYYGSQFCHSAYPSETKKFGLSKSEVEHLIYLNDAENRDFNQIANYIEENL